MNLKLIIQLSLFGLIMAFATVSLVPEKVEWVFWLVIFAFVAYVIAKAAPGKYFLHGFLVSMFNSVWLTAIHLLNYKSYLLHHPDMAAMGPQTIHPRLFMIGSGLLFGIFFGLFQGLFAFIAAKLVKPTVAVR